MHKTFHRQKGKDSTRGILKSGYLICFVSFFFLYHFLPNNLFLGKAHTLTKKNLRPCNNDLTHGTYRNSLYSHKFRCKKKKKYPQRINTFVATRCVFTKNDDWFLLHNCALTSLSTTTMSPAAASRSLNIILKSFALRREGKKKTN